MSNTKSAVLKKIGGVALQVATITFSLLLSISLNTCKETRAHRKEAAVFLQDLRQDLVRDTASMAKSKNELQLSMQSIDEYLQDIQNKQNAEGNKNVDFNVINRKTHSGNYEAFKSSGKIGYIQNKTLKAALMQYYEETMPNLEDVEKANKDAVVAAGELWFQTPPNQIFKNQLLGAKVHMMMQSGIEILNRYDQTIKESASILSEIDKKTE